MCASGDPAGPTPAFAGADSYEKVAKRFFWQGALATIGLNEGRLLLSSL